MSPGGKSHGNDINANFFIKNRQFIFVAADTTKISGCGIDASARIIDNLQRSLWLDGNNQNCVYYQNTGQSIKVVQRYLIPSLIEKGDITEETLVFKNDLHSLGQYREGQWQVKAGDSLVKKRFANKEVITSAL